MSNETRLSRFVRRLRLLLPDAFDRIPSTREMEESDDVIARSIVQQHAEGSVLLSAGRFEIDGDILENDE